MTTINNIEDLIRVLDEHPEWLDAVRRRVLSRELYEMPERLARFAESVMQQFEQQAERLTAIEGRLDVADTKFDRIDQRFDEVDQRFEQVDRRFEQVDQRFQQVDARFDRVERQLETIRNDLAPIKGRYARDVTHDQADGIAYRMGLWISARLTQRDLLTMVRNSDTSNIARNDLESFIAADLVFLAADDENNEVYVAVEASHTADERDTGRAIRNAQFLTRFTGADAKAVITAARIDNRIEETVNSGQVSWHRLDEA